MLHGPCLLLFTPELSVQPPGPGPGLGLTASLQTQSMLLNRGEMLAQGRQAEQVNMYSPGGKNRLFWYRVGLGNLSSLRLAPIFLLYSVLLRTHWPLLILESGLSDSSIYSARRDRCHLQWLPKVCSPGGCASGVTISLLFLFRYVLSLAVCLFTVSCSPGWP